MNPHKEFCLYFQEIDNLGIGFGLSDLYEKARELGLGIKND